MQRAPLWPRPGLSSYETRVVQNTLQQFSLLDIADRGRSIKTCQIFKLSYIFSKNLPGEIEMCHTQFTSKTVEYKWLQIHENHIYVNCDWRNEYKNDPRRYECYWTSSENKNWKKNSGPYEIWTQRSWEVMGDHGFKSRTGLNFFSGLIFTTSSVVFITTRIAFIFFTLKYFLFIGCFK